MQVRLFAQIITIGTGTTTYSNVPTRTDSNYSYTQQIYTAAEITQGGSVCGISFRVSSSDEFSRTVIVYLGHTNKSTFSSTSDWESNSSLTQVFSGSVAIIDNNWVYINFDIPFIYNGTQNLIVAVDDNSQIKETSTTFRYTSATNRVLYYNSSLVNPSIQSPPNGTRSNNRNNIRFHFCSPTLMSSTPLSSCDLLYADPAGMNNYGANINITQTITASTLTNTHLVLDFMELSVGIGDTLWIYNGPNTSSSLIGYYSNVNFPFQINASGTALTFRFKSDNANFSSGWLAHLYCSYCDPVSISSGSPCQPNPQSSTGFASSPFCTDVNPYGITFNSATSGDANVFINTPIGCLSSAPRPAWYFMQINSPGNMLINIVQTATNGNAMDVDFACWGPFYALNQADFIQRLCCGEYNLYTSSGTSHRPTNGNHTNNMGGYPINNLIDCSYSSYNTEWCYIPNAQMGQFYILLITNYYGGNGTINFNTVIQYTTATTDCSLLAQVSNNGPVCVGGTIQLTCNNPQPNATYSWTGPNGFTSNLPNPIISNITSENSGAYTLVISANNQSSSPATTNIVVYPVPNVNLTASSYSVCSGNSTTLTASGAASYLWDNTLGTGSSKTVSPTSTTTYIVTGTSAICSDTASCTIVVRPKPNTQIATPDLDYCPNISTIPISTTTSGGGGIYSYSWLGSGVVNLNSNNTQITINPNDCNEIYTAFLTVTDQYGCFDKDTARFHVIDTLAPLITPLPFAIQTANGSYPNFSIPDFSTFVINNTSDNCYQNNQLSFSQNPVAGTSISSATYVQVTVTDPCGNTRSTYIRVMLPLFAYISDSANVSCFNGNNGSATVFISGGITPYTITWNSNPVQQSYTATGLIAGNYQVTITDSLNTNFTAYVHLTQPAPFTTQLNDVTGSFCPTIGVIPINTITSGGIGTYQYNWDGNVVNNINNDSTLLTISPNDCNEIYQTIITATDQVGCIAKDTTYFTVIDTTAPQFTTLPFAIQTASGTYPNFTVPDFSIYVLNNCSDNCWTNSQITYNQSIAAGTQVSSSTVLLVTISDPCGNARSEFIRLILPLHGSITNIVNANCNNQSNGSATVTALGGILPYSYSWNTSPIQNTQTAHQLSAGNYQVTITDSLGTTYTVSVQITQPAAITSIITVSNVLCYGDATGSVQITPSGGSPEYTYLWNIGTVTNSITNLHAGNYSVTITDSHNCTAQKNTTITQPSQLTVHSETSVSLCQTGSGSIELTTSGGVSPYTNLWNTGEQTNFISNLITGIYFCTVTDHNGCIKIVTDTINSVNPMYIDTISSIMETCDFQNGSINIITKDGTPPYNYLWNNGLNTGTNLQNLNSGFYHVTVTDQNQCSDTASVFVDLFDIQSFIESITPSICERDDGSVSIRVEGGTGFYNYVWFNIDHYTDNFAFNLAPGSYKVSIKDLDCIDTLNFIINEIHKPIACFETSSNVGLLIHQSFLSTNCSEYATQYHWVFGDGSGSQIENPTHFYNEAGLKFITLIASNDYDCIDSVTHTILVNEVSIIYIPNSFTPNNDGLNDVFIPVCSFVNESGFSMKIFNRWGEEIFYSTDFQYGWDGIMNGIEVPSGSYSYLIIYENLFGQAFRKTGVIQLIR